MNRTFKYLLVSLAVVLSLFSLYPALASQLAGQDFTYILVDSADGQYHYRVTLL